jgi:hypothetical protein
LRTCDECREWVNLFRIFDIAEYEPLPDAPPVWIDRAISLMTDTKVIKKIRHFVADLAFDSWVMPHPVGVRGINHFDHRRIRFEKNDVIFDIRVEHRDRDWSFVGQVISGLDINFILKMETTAIFADSSGLYQWSGKKPPKKMSLHSSDFIIEIPELKWKKSR